MNQCLYFKYSPKGLIIIDSINIDQQIEKQYLEYFNKIKNPYDLKNVSLFYLSI